MKSSQNSFKSFDEFNENEYYITPSEMLEFLYCKRFIYFMKYLGIEQYEEKRYKVLKGRTIHEKKEIENANYLRKKINVIDKKINVSMVSKVYGIKGIVDEVLTLSDGTMAPLDYKFAEYKGKVYETYKMQAIMYSLMISETFESDVKRGFILYCRGKNVLKEIDLTEKDIHKLSKYLEEFRKILTGYYPKATSYKQRCTDCCYRNICVK
ncbi:CRISPR-associated exonuclease Cas4 [Methanococcus maripaludis]|uniref:CRISPR-associated exonuclease Cas4 n=1 Tax=Methanococcus maripaludis TaxID=39152 RepID=A0A7J9S5W6_METMI|nr:CRISPR-associated protein Cas4 [Methanococcus maripaludis]MBA2869038.1 CRISPR-associated exonuclease Cas4 [Methanococcus maripaludis]MBB6401700.1 CRISPR-associated exonuclease Cas4 [Methanococcus maripaludis]